MADERKVFEIDWDLEKEDFVQLINTMINQCVNENKVLALPLQLMQGFDFAAELALVISQVDCKKYGCSRCCECPDVKGQLIAIMKGELNFLTDKYGVENFVTNGQEYGLEYPCRFLKSGRCSIYQERPMSCMLYPFQPGGSAGEDVFPVVALSASCPAARRITRDVYMITWKLRQQLKRLDVLKGD